MGVKLAQGLSSSNVLNFIELSARTSALWRLEIPKSWQRPVHPGAGRAGQAYQVTIIAVRGGRRRPAGRWPPAAPSVLESRDAVVTLGRTEDINRLHDL